MRLTASDAWVRFGSHDALRSVDLQVESGEVLCLAGPNGAGKSTLLRSLCGIEPLASGTVDLDGEPVDGATRRVAFLPNPPPLYPYLTVDEHLRLVTELWDSAGVFADHTWWETSGLEGLGRRVPEQLSLGQCQALSIGLLSIPKPDVWLLDEPFNGLDVDASGRLCSFLGSASARGAAVLVATHLFSTFAQLATRLVWIDAGAIVADRPLGGDLVEQVAGLGR